MCIYKCLALAQPAGNKGLARARERASASALDAALNDAEVMIFFTTAARLEASVFHVERRDVENL